jgi:Tryptophan halogenase
LKPWQHFGVSLQRVRSIIITHVCPCISSRRCSGFGTPLRMRGRFALRLAPQGDDEAGEQRTGLVRTAFNSSFLEPLEATSIHGTLVQLILLTSQLAEPPALAWDRYNKTVSAQVDDFRDFIRLHYVSERRDTPFWRDLATTQPADLTDRLAHWRLALPQPGAFPRLPGDLPHVSHHLHMPVFDGLGLLDPATAKSWLAGRPRLRAHARKQAEALTREYRLAASRAPGHRQFLDSLSERVPT